MVYSLPVLIIQVAGDWIAETVIFSIPRSKISVAHTRFSSSAQPARLPPCRTRSSSVLYAVRDMIVPSPPAPSAAHLSSVAGSRSSARRAGTCEWSCRSESASPGSCTGPRSRRCTCHLRSGRAVGSPGARKRPLQETDETASATRKLPGGHVQMQTKQVYGKALRV